MSRQEKKEYYIVHKQLKLLRRGTLGQGDLLESKDQKTFLEAVLNKVVKLSREDVKYIQLHGRITEDEYLVLLAINSPEKRFQVFEKEKGLLKLGAKANIGTPVEVKINRGFVTGTIMWKDTFDGCEDKQDKPRGLHFGIKLERPVGDTNGTLKINGEEKGFTCAENYGIYVNIRQLRFVVSKSADSGTGTWSAEDAATINQSRSSIERDKAGYDQPYTVMPHVNQQLPDDPGGRALPYDNPGYEVVPRRCSIISGGTTETAEATNCFKEDQRVYFMLKGSLVSGKIKWLGKIQGSDAINYAGIKLDVPYGNCNGTWEIIQSQHFVCDQNEGIYLPFECLSTKEFFETNDFQRQLEAANKENDTLKRVLETSIADRQVAYEELEAISEAIQRDLDAKTVFAKELQESQNSFWPKKGWIRFRRCCCCMPEEKTQ